MTASRLATLSSKSTKPTGVAARSAALLCVCFLACAAVGCGRSGRAAAGPPGAEPRTPSAGTARPAEGPTGPGLEPGGAKAGEPARDFALTTLTGDKIRLSGLKGKPVLVNFWATWCPACNSELPALEAAYRKHHPEGLELLGVAAKDTEAAVKDTVKQKGLTYPVGLNEAAARAYAVTAIPTSVFVRRDGRIASVTVGGLTREQIESKLKGIM